jgi:hypothetical protein
LALVARKSHDQHGNANGEKFLGACKLDLRWWSSGEGKANVILQSDTVWPFSSRFVMIEADGAFIKPLQTLVGMKCEDS